MNTAEIITAILGVLALVVSALAVISSRAASKRAEDATKRAEDLRVAVAKETTEIKTDVGWLKVLVNEIRGKKRKEH